MWAVLPASGRPIVAEKESTLLRSAYQLRKNSVYGLDVHSSQDQGIRPRLREYKRFSLSAQLAIPTRNPQ